MTTFLSRFADGIHGVLSGFDRIRFRGTQRLIAHANGLNIFLHQAQIRFTQFRAYAEGVTTTMRQSVETQAESHGVPVVYLESSAVNKEEFAAELARKAGRSTGLQAIFSVVEPCRSFNLVKDAATGHVTLASRLRKCLHYYHYWRHPVLGPCHVRLQTWFPFNVFVCINGREMLALQLAQAGVDFRQRDNCFSWVSDVARAQTLLHEQVKRDWASALTDLLTQTHPTWRSWPAMDRDYYWTADQTEWATDVMFRSQAQLSRLMPHFLRYSLTGLGCLDVMKFLGRSTRGERINPQFAGECGVDVKTRPEGARAAFRVNRNQVKFYDKQGSVLRIETTINDARDMKSYRAAEGDPDGPKAWRPMKKGVSDLPRRTTLSQAANDRCLESLAAVASPATVAERVSAVAIRKTWKGQRVRGLNPFGDDDRLLLHALADGGHDLHGFRNRDVRARVPQWSAGAVTHRLRLLRAHGVIRKVPHTHRYTITPKGRELLAAVALTQQNLNTPP